MEEVFKRLRKARAQAGYTTATDAARAFNWNENTYRSHENGERGVKPHIAQRYAEAFQVSSAWLLTGEGSSIEPKDINNEIANIVQLLNDEEKNALLTLLKSMSKNKPSQ